MKTLHAVLEAVRAELRDPLVILGLMVLAVVLAWSAYETVATGLVLSGGAP